MFLSVYSLYALTRSFCTENQNPWKSFKDVYQSFVLHTSENVWREYAAWFRLLVLFPNIDRCSLQTIVTCIISELTSIVFRGGITQVKLLGWSFTKKTSVKNLHKTVTDYRCTLCKIWTRATLCTLKHKRLAGQHCVSPWKQI